MGLNETVQGGDDEEPARGIKKELPPEGRRSRRECPRSSGWTESKSKWEESIGESECRQLPVSGFVPVKYPKYSKKPQMARPCFSCLWVSQTHNWFSVKID